MRDNRKLHVESKKFEIQCLEIYAVLQLKRTYLHGSIKKVSQFFWHASFVHRLF